MKRKRLIIGFLLLNAILATALFYSPVAAQIFPKLGIFDCRVGGECCDNCCWLKHDCDFF